ncbi:MAG TPA: alpha/beta hydrolase [Acidimicrobiia bacterium]|nr:alpha/beta hydrolase [Acidimicrobiia bacterium]
MALKAYAGGVVFAESTGTAPRVLALHGWGRRATDFRSAFQGLDYLAPDLPGFGASPPPAEVIGSREYAAILTPLLEELGERAVLVGHSFGGRVALHLANSHPDLFTGLVLTGAPLVRLTAPTKPPRLFRLARRAEELGVFGEARMERIRQRYGSPDYRATSGVMRKILVRTINESYQNELAALELPVLLVWGAQDREVPVATAERLTALIPTAELQILDGVGHGLPLEAPRALRDAVEKMLTR